MDRNRIIYKNLILKLPVFNSQSASIVNESDVSIKALSILNKPRIFWEKDTSSIVNESGPHRGALSTVSQPNAPEKKKSLSILSEPYLPIKSSDIPYLETHIELTCVPFPKSSQIDFRAEPLRKLLPEWLTPSPSNTFRRVMV